MPKYLVVLHGKNFRMRGDGVAKTFGFFQNIYVESVDPEQAELDAVELARDSDELKSALINPREDPPMLYLDEMFELESFDGVERRVQGRVFYDESADEEE